MQQCIPASNEPGEAFAARLRSGSEISLQPLLLPRKVPERSEEALMEETHLMNANGRFGCTKCQNSYTQMTNLRRHLKYECGIPPQFECPICHRKFVYKFRMKQHRLMTHPQLESSEEMY
ncbi:hypothetical protein HUJ04_008543 [Dendroctonus ponderosae]|nr:hypothetical protein HUJ04_008543 [Dendroctonus ponderosae]KAH1008451.1 hypothetical protein HUJ05_009005 [Dendroctonus ponderosae]